MVHLVQRYSISIAIRTISAGVSVLVGTFYLSAWNAPGHGCLRGDGFCRPPPPLAVQMYRPFYVRTLTSQNMLMHRNLAYLGSDRLASTATLIVGTAAGGRAQQQLHMGRHRNWARS